jgi:O-antigen/teichoic acid export membrane protein
MAMKGRFIKGGFIMAGSNIVQQALLFIRNIVLALLLPPEMFGIALTLVTVISALDAVSELGIELFVVRSSKFADDSFLNSMHLMLVIRGCVSAIAILLLARAFGWLFSTPEAVWAYRWLALVPLLRGFMHLDMRRFERQQNYGPGSLANLIASFVGTVVALVVGYLTKSYEAMLIAYILQTGVFVVCSHAFARSGYGLRYDKKETAELLPFSAPLILNGILLFSIVQGDRILVGSKFGMKDLASYGVLSVFTVGVTLLVAKLAHPLYLPILAEAKLGSADYDRRYIICGSVQSMMSIASILTFGIIGYAAAQLAFGSKYTIEPHLVLFLGLQSGFKIIRSWPQIGLIAYGNTKELLYANLVSLAGIGSATALVFLGHGLVHVAAAMAFGEALAALYSLARAGEKGSAVRRHGLMIYLGLCIVAAILLGAHHIGWLPVSLLPSLLLAGVGGIAAFAYINFVSVDFWSALGEILGKLRKRS